LLLDEEELSLLDELDSDWLLELELLDDWLLELELELLDD